MKTISFTEAQYTEPRDSIDRVPSANPALTIAANAERMMEEIIPQISGALPLQTKKPI